MMKKCNGCGSIFQTENTDLEGYIREDNIGKSDICERCFRIKNYGEYKIIDKTNIDFIPILKDINETDDLVVLVIDVFNIPMDLSILTNNISNDILLVFTKKDILPYKISDDKILEYNNILNINCIDKIVVSSNKNYNFDLLYEKINCYKKSNNVYIVGFTNAGKSTLINKIIYNYTDLNSNITTSILPSTTIDTIKININDNLTIIDTPGILEESSILNYVDTKTLKKIIPKNEIKPITYQAREKQYIFIEDLLKIEVENNNLTFYKSNNLGINRYYKDKDLNLKENIIRVNKNEDIVVLGLGFIRVSKPGVIKVWTFDKVAVYTRKSLI